jgi:hypothetical protein
VVNEDESNRLRVVEMKVAAFEVMVSSMKDDIHTIKNAIIFSMCVLVSTLFAGVLYFVNQRDATLQRMDRTSYEIQGASHSGATTNNNYGTNKAPPVEAIDAPLPN